MNGVKAKKNKNVSDNAMMAATPGRSLTVSRNVELILGIMQRPKLYFILRKIYQVQNCQMNKTIFYLILNKQIY